MVRLCGFPAINCLKAKGPDFSEVSIFLAVMYVFLDPPPSLEFHRCGSVCVLLHLKFPAFKGMTFPSPCYPRSSKKTFQHCFVMLVLHYPKKQNKYIHISFNGCDSKNIGIIYFFLQWPFFKINYRIRPNKNQFLFNLSKSKIYIFIF